MSGDPSNMMARFILEKTDDSQPQQGLTGTGRYKEKFGGQVPIPRFGSYGFHYHAPAGSHGYVNMPGGNPDLAHVISLEHPDHRPTGTTEGESMQYAMWGQKVYCKADGSVLIKCSGSAYILIKGDDIMFVGNVKLGSESASRPVSAQGTVDTGGFADTSNPLTKVWGV